MKLRTFVKACVGIAMMGCAFAADPPREAAGMKPGETRLFDKGNLKITFVKVAAESRCPVGVQCVWAGDADVILRIKAGKQEEKNYHLHTNLKPKLLNIPAEVLPPDSMGIMKRYLISIGSLTPQPKVGSEIKPADYRLVPKVGIAQ